MAQQPRANKRPRRSKALTNHLESLTKLQQWLLGDEAIFSTIKLHGKIQWTLPFLVWLALSWSWSEARCLTDAFGEAVGVCEKMFACTPLTTYQGFMWALVRYTPLLLPQLRMRLQQRMAQLDSKFWRIDGWVPIAFDGSRSTAPRTRSNEARLCAKNYGQGKTAKYRKKKSKGMRRKRNDKNKAHPQEPQVWITMLWHMGLRLPWDWRLGPSDSSERDHVLQMLQAGDFPSGTLFCGDAGFVGYPFWSKILKQGGNFLVRVGGNVHLLHQYAQCAFEKKGKERFVLCWPKNAQQANQPPLRLRLLKVRIGKTQAWLLTSVLQREQLTVASAVRLYKMCWGIEVEYRGLKQTLDRGKLRSRNSERLLVELDWSILALAVAELLALKQQQAKRPQQAGKPAAIAEPAKRSLAATMRALRRCMRNLDEIPKAGHDLQSELRAAVTDSYRRKQQNKRARYRPPNPDKKPLVDPNVRPLDELEKQKLQATVA
jgi:Transposase DDE domain